MKIYLLRHTTLNIEPDIFYGQSDVDVSSTFKDEVEIIKHNIKEKKIDIANLDVFSSPLTRCKKLADEIFSNFKLDDRLKELHFGDWEMKSLLQIPKTEITEWERNLMTFQIPNGETNKEFFNRLSFFCDEIVSRGKNVFIVAHAGSINCILSYLTDIPFDKTVKENWKRISHGSLSCLIKKEKKFYVKYCGV